MVERIFSVIARSLRRSNPVPSSRPLSRDPDINTGLRVKPAMTEKGTGLLRYARNDGKGRAWAVLLLLLIFFAAIRTTSYAQETPLGPVRLHADNVQFSSEENKSTLLGNVVAVGDNYTLTADTVDIYFTEENRIQRIICRDNVNFKTDEILAVSDYAELDQRTKLIHLNGASRIWQNENYLEGEHMEINYDTREIYVNKGDAERVTVIFNRL